MRIFLRPHACAVATFRKGVRAIQLVGRASESVFLHLSFFLSGSTYFHHISRCLSTSILFPYIPPLYVSPLFFRHRAILTCVSFSFDMSVIAVVHLMAKKTYAPASNLAGGTGKCKCALWLSNLFYLYYFSPFLHLTPVLLLHFSSSNKLYVPPQPPFFIFSCTLYAGRGPSFVLFSLHLCTPQSHSLSLSLPPPILVSHHLLMLEHTYWVICYTPPPSKGYLCTENWGREYLFWEDIRIILLGLGRAFVNGWGWGLEIYF